MGDEPIFLKKGEIPVFFEFPLGRLPNVGKYYIERQSGLDLKVYRDKMRNIVNVREILNFDEVKTYFVNDLGTWYLVRVME